MKNRIVWIDILRIIGLFAVIMMHIIGNTINTYGGLSLSANYIFVVIAILLEFAVPLFIMISGMIFLSRNISFKDMFKKYILKILLVIMIIGTSMIITEELFINKTFSLDLLQKVFIRLITGDIWAHMWYLYLIIGLYLITPVLNIITANIKQDDYKIFLIFLFSLTIVISTLNDIFNIKIAFNTIEISGYLFYYFYGYYLYKYDISNKFKIVNYLISFLSIIYVFYLAKKNASLTLLFGYTTFIPFIFASSLVLLFKNKDINLKTKNFIHSIGMCNLGIYVLHQLFINIIFKVLKIKYIVSYPCLGLIIYTIIVFTVSYICSYLLRKNLLIRKYLL